MSSLARKSVFGLVQLQVILALLLFVPAGTIRWWQGWVYWAVFGGSCAAITAYFLTYDPALVERRMATGPTAERETSQKIIQAVAGAMFVLLMVVPALDHRYHWSAVPTHVVVAGDALVVAALLGFFLVMRENSFAASTIKVEEAQRVISTGPYRFVRHPMYAAGTLLFVGSALALGSLWALIMAAGVCAAMVARLLDEERFLSANLPGYDDYRRNVRHRLIPMVW
ncbi:MAG TPA: isoprenylcysteine carboxylmethyltransferase family protein [Candidatus Acidoferrales bacterium]|nr:isoprenylcysteine carboxylmethyltransferase family protein [Candidatus Acidoferrales bacterium]